MFRSRFAIAFLAALAVAPAFAGEDISKVNGSITAEAGKQYRDLSTVNGSIRIGDGTRFEDAETVNGSIRAGNRVEGRSLETVNGSIQLGDEATVRSLSTVNGSIRAGHGLRAARGIETVSGSVFLDRGGNVEGNVKTVSGGIGLVATEVGGDIETVNGDVTVGVGSHVRGGLTVHKPSGAKSSWFLINVSKRKPRIIIGPDAVVDGELVFEREVTLYVHESARTGRITGAEPVAYSSARAPRD